VRTVTAIERKYLGFDGLNLTWETLEGLAKHNGPITDPINALSKVLRRLETWQSFDGHHWPSAEAQAASLADDIAYLTHDIDDGLRAHLITVDDLADVALAGPHVATALAKARGYDDARIVYEVTRQMITGMIRDVVAESRARLVMLGPDSPDAIRAAGQATVAFSADMAAGVAGLRAFMFEHVYRHPRVVGVMSGAEQIVSDLFRVYSDFDHPSAMPVSWVELMKTLPTRGKARVAADYLAGQTDRYALDEHRRLFKATPELK
jgi:dGTPase